MSRLDRWWRSHRVAVVVAGVAAAALAIGGAFIWPITDLIAAHDVGRIASSQRAAHLQTAREAVRTQLLTLAAGVFVVGALWYTAQNYRLSRQGQVTDRYTRAIEQVGSDKLDVRTGAIYALERISRDSAADHPTVIEVLAAFIREHSREQWQSPEPGGEMPRRTTRPDVQAALTVIGRRNAQHDRQPVHLTGADLTGADLTGANLGSTEFTGANLTRASLADANLTGAVLIGADLTDAFLHGADLTDAFPGAANLTRANLFDSKLNNTSFAAADLTGANLAGADLTGAILSRAKLSGASLTGAILSRASLSGAEFSGAELTNALWPDETPVPEGWVRLAGSGRLRPAFAKADDSGN
jgi:hypothetical protein